MNYKELIKLIEHESKKDCYPNWVYIYFKYILTNTESMTAYLLYMKNNIYQEFVKLRKGNIAPEEIFHGIDIVYYYDEIKDIYESEKTDYYYQRGKECKN